jgi:hypothetical protein
MNKHLLTEKKQSRRGKRMRNEKKVPFSLHFITIMLKPQTNISKKIDIYISLKFSNNRGINIQQYLLSRDFPMK